MKRGVWLVPRQFFAGCRKRLREDLLRLNRGAEISDSLSAFNHDLIRIVEGFIHDLSRGVLSADLIGGRLKTKYESLNALQQRVVQFTRDPFALDKAFLKRICICDASCRRRNI